MASTIALAKPKREHVLPSETASEMALGSLPIDLMCWPVKRITAIAYCLLFHPDHRFFHGGSFQRSWPSHTLQMVLW